MSLHESIDTPGCCEHVAQAESKSALQGSGLVRTVPVGPYAQRRVVLIPQAIARARRIVERLAQRYCIAF